jgi:DNA-damage-inducible protein J
MANADAVVRARIDQSTKREAIELFQKMGITISDAIRMMLIQAVAQKALPFEVRIPNEETVAALLDSRNGLVTRVASMDELFADIDDEDGV